MDYGNRIKQIRKTKGIKACYVAEKLGITPGGYSDLERGRRKLTAERAQQIANILEVDVKEIFCCANVSETRTNSSSNRNVMNATGTDG